MTLGRVYDRPLITLRRKGGVMKIASLACNPQSSPSATWCAPVASRATQLPGVAFREVCPLCASVVREKAIGFTPTGWICRRANAALYWTYASRDYFLPCSSE